MKRVTRATTQKSNTVQKKLVGTWLLESFRNKGETGDKEFPFGRNPEAASKVQTAMVLAIAFAEAIAIYALVVALILKFVN